jgi:hypothetical protein
MRRNRLVGRKPNLFPKTDRKVLSVHPTRTITGGANSPCLSRNISRGRIEITEVFPGFRLCRPQWETGEFAGAVGVGRAGAGHDHRDAKRPDSAAEMLTLAPFAPAIFNTNAAGSSQGAILDASYRLVDSANPAAAGSSVVLIYCTGLGAVTNQPATGSPGPSDRLAWSGKGTAVPVVISISGAASNTVTMAVQ